MKNLKFPVNDGLTRLERLKLIYYTTKSSKTSRLPWSREGRVNSVRASDLFSLHDKDWKRLGSSHNDHNIDHESDFDFQSQNTPSKAPLPLIDKQSNSSKVIRRHILIVDDDATVRGSLASVLEFEGFDVDEASDGLEAIEHAAVRTPDLVLLDLNMPKIDGWTAFEKLNHLLPLLPVIVITARPHQYKEAVKLGVDAFMEKPLNISILVRAIKKLCNENEKRHLHRITNPKFVTHFLGNTGS